MYLYEQIGNEILTYEMTINEEKARNFREKMIRKTSPDNYVYRAITSREGLLLTEQAVTWKMLNGRNYHIMEEYKDSGLIKQYINGEFQDKKIIQVMNDNAWGYKYLLLTNNCYQIENKETNIKTMQGIISIPKSLCILHILENGEFAKIYEGKRDLPIDEQLQLFNYTGPIDRFSLTRIQKAIKLGIISDDNIAYNNPNGLAATSKILKKVREMK